ncbi:MAG: hypothetical protein QOD49_1506 [Actinomycetota bacterium]|nr:hypothetical protein [Actinomycetota bacterium]
MDAMIPSGPILLVVLARRTVAAGTRATVVPARAR